MYDSLAAKGIPLRNGPSSCNYSKMLPIFYFPHSEGNYSWYALYESKDGILLVLCTTGHNDPLDYNLNRFFSPAKLDWIYNPYHNDQFICNKSIVWVEDNISRYVLTLYNWNTCYWLNFEFRFDLYEDIDFYSEDLHIWNIWFNFVQSLFFIIPILVKRLLLVIFCIYWLASRLCGFLIKMGLRNLFIWLGFNYLLQMSLQYFAFSWWKLLSFFQYKDFELLSSCCSSNSCLLSL
jgi:hypothetical protein